MMVETGQLRYDQEMAGCCSDSGCNGGSDCSSTPLFVGAAAPESFQIKIVAGDSGLDLSTVISATLLAVHANGVQSVWSPVTIVQKIATCLVLQYVFSVAGTDLVKCETISVVPRLVFPDGMRRAVPICLRVIDVRNVCG
jgi:hypothetical protein